MIRERYLNLAVLALLAALAIWAKLGDQPFTITLLTKVLILGLAAAGLNIALGLGGLSRADAETPYHDAALRKDRPVILYCASGGRSALGGKLLKDMGYEQVYNLGGFKDWAEAGGETEPA